MKPASTSASGGQARRPRFLIPITMPLPLPAIEPLLWGDEPGEPDESDDIDAPRAPAAPAAPSAPSAPSAPGVDAEPEEGPAVPRMPFAPRQPEMATAPAQDDEDDKDDEDDGEPSRPSVRVGESAGRRASAADQAAVRDADAGPSPPVPAGSGPSPRAREALEVARREIGVRESPAGSNRGPQVDVYQGGKGQYWCCHFVSWCFEQTGQSPFGHLASVDSLRRWAKLRSKYLPARSAPPAAGDLFTMARTDKAGRVVGGHVGFVQGFDPRGGTIRTIEGNISDRVGEMTRQVASVDGFIRL